MHLARRASHAAGIVLLSASGAAAQTTVVLPDTSQTTTLSVDIAEQARITVPAGISFSVTNVNAVTVASAATVTIDPVVLSSPTAQLQVSLRANAPAFSPPAPGDTTWSAGDVSWNAATWSAGTGSNGTLSNGAFGTVAICAPGAAACSTTGLTFSLAPAAGVQRAGAHTLVVTWKVESIGS